MDKPISMSVKDYLIRTLAVKILTSEKTIEAVINHQFQSANEAMDLHNSIELSVFGKFFFNDKKAIKRVNSLIAKKLTLENTLADDTSSEQKKNSARVTLDKTLPLIESLTTKSRYED
jgi:nucleoid DNA-binding protein